MQISVTVEVLVKLWKGWEAMSALAFTGLHNFSWMFVPLGNIMVYVAISTRSSGNESYTSIISVIFYENESVI